MTDLYENENKLISLIAPHLDQLGVSYIIAAPFKKSQPPLFVINFGSVAGMGIAPLLDPAPIETESFVDYNNARIPISRINIDFLEICSVTDVVDMLLDWGYFGPPDKRPAFLEHRV